MTGTGRFLGSRSRWLSLVVATAMVATLAACGGDTTDDPTPPAPPAGTPTQPADEPTEPDATEPDPIDDEVTGDPELLWSYDHEETINTLAMSPDGHYLLVGERATYTHQLADGFLLDAYVLRQSPESLAFGDDTTLAIGQTSFGVVLIDTTTGEEIAQIAATNNARVAYAADGSQLAVGDRDGNVRILDAATQQVEATLTGDEWVWAVEFSPDGSLLAVVGHMCGVRVWDTATQQLRHELQLETGDGSCLLSERPFRFSPDGSMMAGAVQEGGTQVIRMWDAATGSPQSDIEAPARVRSIDFSPDGQLLAVASNTAAAVVDVAAGTVRHMISDVPMTGTNPLARAAAFSPDGGHVAFGWSDGLVEVWRLPGAEVLVAPVREVCEPLPLPGDVLFDTGSSTLRADADEALTTLAEELRSSHPDATLTFVGHTDSRGSAAANLQLSQDRAASVAAWFEAWASSEGVTGWTFATDGRGDTELKVPDVDADGNFLPGAGAINRRVEIEITSDRCA
jgi:WD40 repeat protein